MLENTENSDYRIDLYSKSALLHVKIYEVKNYIDYIQMHYYAL